MPGPGLTYGRWLLMLAAAAAGSAWLASGRAEAQDRPLVFEKQLDLKLNPIPGYVNAMTQPPQMLAPPDVQSLSLPALMPGSGTTDDASARIIMGTPAKAGTWRSAFNFGVGYAGPDGKDRISAPACGASLIDAQWALTAAHCVFRAEFGGLDRLKWVTGFADDVRVLKGRPLRVKAVYVHRQYDHAWTLNDIALLELEKAVDLPRQKLAGGGSRTSFLSAGNQATIIGWGLTKGDDAKSASAVLLQATLPIASKAVCDAFRSDTKFEKPGRPLTYGDFCAGHGHLGDDAPMTCNGDSGGPVFVSIGTGEPIQAGIVSWGRGNCISLYSAYTNVAHFEAWIRQRVPNAVFVAPSLSVSSGPLAVIAGATPGGPPAALGQCAIDVYTDGVATNTAKVGSTLSVKVTSGVAGQLAVFSRTSEEKVVQLFPNRFASSGAMTVLAGDVVSIGGNGDALSLTVSPPTGRYALIAIVMPAGGALATVAERHADMAPIAGFGGVLARLAEEARALPSDSPRAVCTRQFDVVE